MAPTPAPEPAFTGTESTDTSQHAQNLNDTEKETLESHQVIELQAFSERKAWIEEKIRVSLRCGSILSLLSYHVSVSRAVTSHPSLRWR